MVWCMDGMENKEWRGRKGAVPYLFYSILSPLSFLFGVQQFVVVLLFFAKIINKIKQIIKKKVFIGGCYRKYLIIIIINSLRTGTKFIQLMF
jgi:hypothetical protein